MRVVIKISDLDAIANVIIVLQKAHINVTQLKDEVNKTLIESGYGDAVIKDWMDFIE